MSSDVESVFDDYQDESDDFVPEVSNAGSSEKRALRIATAAPSPPLVIGSKPTFMSRETKVFFHRSCLRVRVAEAQSQSCSKEGDRCETCRQGRSQEDGPNNLEDQGSSKEALKAR